MKLAVDSGGTFLACGVDEGARLIKEAGFDGIDMTFCDASTEVFCREDYMEKAEEVKKALEKYELSCTQAHAPYYFKYGVDTQDDSSFQYLAMKRSLEAAGYLGIDRIVFHGVRLPVPSVSRRNMDFNYDYLKKFEPLCKKYGVRISIENLSGAFTFPDMMNEMIRRLDSPWYTALVDVGHAWLRGLTQPGDFIRQLDPGILTGLHIHDNHGPQSDDEHLMPFLGTIDFHDLMKALKETGYQGDFTYEACSFMDFYIKEGLTAEALKFEAAVGRKLIREFESL